MPPKSLSKGPSGQLEVYQELFFAGFAPYTEKANPKAAKKKTWSSDKVFSIFRHYGEVQHFVFVEEAGCGSVVFANGDSGEKCYLSLHLSCISLLLKEESGTNPGEEAQILYLEYAQALPFVNPLLLLWGEKKTVNLAGAGVNLMRIHNDDIKEYQTFFHAGQISRQLLRHLPTIPFHKNTNPVQEGVNKDVKCVAEWVISSDPKSNVFAFPPFVGQACNYPQELLQRMWYLLKPENANDKNSIRVLDFWWIYYNAFIVRKTQPAVERISEVLFLSSTKKSHLQEVQSLMALHEDVLLEKKRQKKAAAEAKKKQKRVKKELDDDDEEEEEEEEEEEIEGEDPEEVWARLKKRFLEDDVFHTTLTYTIGKVPLENDPSFCSFMRDYFVAYGSSGNEKHTASNLKYSTVIADYIDVDKGIAWENKPIMVFFAAVAQRCQLSSTTGGKKMKTDGEKKKKKQKQGKSLKEMKEERCKDLKSLRTWITLPIVQATANVIDNITLLRKIRRKEVDKHGNDLPKKSDAEKQMEEDQRAMNEALFNDNPIVYPTGTRRQEEESFYSELVQLVDGYCPDGRLSELISVVEDPSIFRFMRDHIGYAELHPDTDWLTYLQIGGIVTTIILIYYAVVSFGRNYVVPKNEEYKQNLIKQQNRERMEQMRKQTEGQYGQRPNETAFEAHQRRMKEMEELARKKGVKMNIRFEADL